MSTSNATPGPTPGSTPGSTPDSAPNAPSGVAAPGEAKSAWRIVVTVLAVIVTAGYLLWSLFFLLLGHGLNDGTPSGGWWWTMIAVTVGLAWHVAAVVLLGVKGLRWVPALLPGVVAALVPAGMSVELFALPALLTVGLTAVLATVVRRTH